MLSHPKKKPFEFRRERVNERVAVDDERECRRRQVSFVVDGRRAHAALVAVGQHRLVTGRAVLKIKAFEY